MTAKIDNVVDCLRRFPQSKRAVVSIPPNDHRRPDHTDDGNAKCMREIHLYLDDDDDGGEDDAGEESEENDEGERRRRKKRKKVLNGTVLMRAQAAEIFPKNVHFVGCLMETVARRLSSSPSSCNNDGDEDDEDDGVRQEQQEQQREQEVRVGELFYLATTLVSTRW